jgi:hypothetical protein
MTDSNPNSDKQPPLSLREVVGSIMAALLGVQSSRNHARDFSRGTAKQYSQISSVMKGMMGCSARSSASSTVSSVRLVVAAAASSPRTAAPVQHFDEGGAHAVLFRLGRLLVVERLGQFQVPVAVLVPDEFVQRRAPLSKR